MKKIFNTLFIASILLSCKSSDKSASSSSAYDVSGYEEVPSEIYTLYIKTEPKTANQLVEIIVLKNSDKSLAYGPDKIKAQVSWHDKNQLIVKEYPGTIKKDEDMNEYIYYIHIPTSKKNYKPVEMM